MKFFQRNVRSCRGLRTFSKKQTIEEEIPIQPIEAVSEMKRPPWYIKNYKGPFESVHDRGTLSITGKEYIDTPTPDMIKLWEKLSESLKIPKIPSQWYNAFTHPSFGYGKIQPNDKLQFIGEHTLKMIVGKHFADQYPLASLTALELLSAINVNHQNLCNLANKWGIGNCVCAYEWPQMSPPKKKKFEVSVMHALVGAVYADHGFETSAKFVLKNYLNSSPRSLFQNMLNANPHYFLEDLCMAMEGQAPQIVIKEVSGGFSASIYLKDVTDIIGYSEAKMEHSAKTLAEINALSKFSAMIPLDPRDELNEIVKKKTK